MDSLKKIMRYYLMGILFSATIVLMIVLFDYFLNGQILCPELSNLISVCLMSGVGFALTIFAIITNYEYKKNKNNQF
jgi:hypothetical protein